MRGASRAAILVVVVVVVVVTLLVPLIDASRRFSRTYRGALHEGLSVSEPTRSSTPCTVFEQLVDHFDPDNRATFAQRICINDTYYRGISGRVLLVLGGEGPLARSYVDGRFSVSWLAQELSALIIGIEHRYYGESRPTADASVTNLKYLTSEQALADAARFRQVYGQQLLDQANMPPDYRDSDVGEWIVFGGSYSGALAAWARVKYTHLFIGAVASSAPVVATEDFPAYLAVVEASLGTECTAALHVARDTIREELTTPQGRTRLSATFHTCTNLTADPQDQLTFLEDITDTISGLVQYNKPDGGGVDAMGEPRSNIQAFCDDVTSTGDPVAVWADLRAQSFDADTTCTASSYETLISDLSDVTSFDSMRLWTYQTCLEFGFFQTGSLAFFSEVNLDFFNSICADAFTALPAHPYIAPTNGRYGGEAIKQFVTNVAFVSGTTDPWHRLSVLPGSLSGHGGTTYDPLAPGMSDLAPGSFAVLVQGTSHVADFYAAKSNDPPALVNARRETEKSLREWHLRRNNARCAECTGCANRDVLKHSDEWGDGFSIGMLATFSVFTGLGAFCFCRRACMPAVKGAHLTKKEHEQLLLAQKGQ